MQTFTFVTPVPIRRHAPCGRALEISDKYRHPACVAKPPPRTPQSDGIAESNKVKRRKTTRPSAPASRRTGELTAAQLSDKLSRAVGFDLILEDVTHLTKFFQSFVKPKFSNRTQEQVNSDPDLDVKSETSLVKPTRSQSYKPKSATAANIATAYTVARGAVDRTFQVFSIHAQSYVNAVTQVAGDTVCKLLSVGHEAFPTLKLDRAKDALTGVLKDGWTPLSVFQWQLSASPAGGPVEDLEQRRQARIQQISKFFRGGGMDEFLNATGSALGGAGKAAEKLAPIMFKGVSKATSGYAKRAHSRNPPQLDLGTKALIRKRQTQKTQRDQVRYLQRLSQPSAEPSINAKTDSVTESLATLQVPRPEVASSIGPGQASFAFSSINAGTPEVRAEIKSRNRAGYDISTSSMSASQGNAASESVQKGNTELLRGSAIVLAAGAVATAAASVSVPTAITCSTLMVASMAFSGAKTANASELQIHARNRVRQSRSVQHLEGVFAKAPVVSNPYADVPRALLAPATRRMRKRKDAVVPTVSPLPTSTSTRTVEQASSNTVDTSAYTVSPSQPRIMSMPIVGFLLNWLDVMAYRMEGSVGTILRRSGLLYALNKKRPGWELLRSFQRSSQPD